MNLLAIETSGPILSVAVKKGLRKIRESLLRGYARHAENLLPLIDRLLKKERLKIREIDAFLIGRGPGSFTGLRVGFATLKGFLAVDPKPCYGALSLDLIAKRIPVQVHKGRKLHVCLDAKRGKLYTRFYLHSRKQWAAKGALAALSFEDWIKRISEETLVAGDGILVDKTNLLRQTKKHVVLLPEKYWRPKASTLIKLFETKDPVLKLLKKPKDFLPFYLRSSEAEERLKMGIGKHSLSVPSTK